MLIVCDMKTLVKSWNAKLEKKFKLQLVNMSGTCLFVCLV